MGTILSRRPAALRHKRVLVVEDEALVAMLIEDALLEADVEVVSFADSVAEALCLIRDGGAPGIDLAVLDLDLGGEAAAPVADALAAAGVPFLIQTGYGEGCDTGGHGGVPVLRKPFDPQLLVAALGALLARAG